MSRDNEILLHEPESIDENAPLSEDERFHRRLHLLLEKTGRNWRDQADQKHRLSDDFDATFRAQLKLAAADSQKQVSIKDLEPVRLKSEKSQGSATGDFLKDMQILWQVSAVIVVIVGIGFGSFRYLSRSSASVTETEPVPSLDSSSDEKMAVPVPSDLPTPMKPPESLAAPAKNDHQFEDQTVDAKDNASEIVNPEIKLERQIAAEQDPLKRTLLKRRLLQIYEATGQTEKADSLRKQLEQQ